MLKSVTSIFGDVKSYLVPKWKGHYSVYYTMQRYVCIGKTNNIGSVLFHSHQEILHRRCRLWMDCLTNCVIIIPAKLCNQGKHFFQDIELNNKGILHLHLLLTVNMASLRHTIFATFAHIDIRTKNIWMGYICLFIGAITHVTQWGWGCQILLWKSVMGVYGSTLLALQGGVPQCPGK